MTTPSLPRPKAAVTLLVLLAAGCSSGTNTSGGGKASEAGASGGAGTTGSGGSQSTGGATSGSGAASSNGGSAGTGGNPNAGGSGAGGVANTGGAIGAGGSAAGGVPGTGGVSGSGGAGGAPSNCKRGIATNTAPGAAFSPAITWWYNWAVKGSGANVGIEFVPMIWGAGSLNATLPAGSKYLLTFNEPNFHAQSNLTAAQAAADWPTIETKAAAAGIPIVGPGMNFCGPAANCNGTSP
jgi:hypothetical protein